jgi:hypothetical protein
VQAGTEKQPPEAEQRNILTWAAKNQTMALVGPAIRENFFLSVNYLTTGGRFLNDAAERGADRPPI